MPQSIKMAERYSAVRLGNDFRKEREALEDDNKELSEYGNHIFVSSVLSEFKEGGIDHHAAQKKLTCPQLPTVPATGPDPRQQGESKCQKMMKPNGLLSMFVETDVGLQR